VEQVAQGRVLTVRVADGGVMRRPAAGGWLARRFGYEERSALLFLLPLLVVLGAVAVFPVVYAGYISLFRLKLTRPNRVPFVGLDNYVTLLRDPVIWTCIERTAVFTVFCVIGVSVIALGVALLLDQTFRGRRIVAALLLVPWAIPSVANGLMWKWIYNSDYGALNGALLQLGLVKHYLIWLGDPAKTLILIANAFVWKEVPLAAILLLVTMKSIPDDLYRAARVDGAHVLQRFLHITLPSLRPGFLLVIIYECMMAVRHFDLFYLLTEGGPGDASNVAAWQVYVESFRNLSFGTGSALAYLLAIATFALSYGVIRGLGSKL
jgi:multiple sugar transport system permease protein